MTLSWYNNISIVDAKLLCNRDRFPTPYPGDYEDFNQTLTDPIEEYMVVDSDPKNSFVQILAHYAPKIIDFFDDEVDSSL